MPSTTVNIRVHFAWWWPLHHVYFALLLAAVRLGILSGERGLSRAQAFALAAARAEVGDRPIRFGFLCPHGPFVIQPFGRRFLAFTWQDWGCHIWLWRRAKYLCVTWGRQGYRIYLSRNATPWGAYWGIGWFDGRFKWRHRGERC